jgi:endoglycosylceramidase
VYKIAPWHPATSGYDSTTTLSDTDAANLSSWGFNIVRLGVMWPGVEPTQGNYDQSYLNEIEKIVTSLAKQNIYVILDFHQDLWHRKFCGEGVPDYVYELCKSSEPADTKQFPLPAVNSTYPIDADGNPTIEACLSTSFATYYFSNEVGAGFQCLYENQHNLWDAFANYWKVIATRFHTFDNVLGYELLNEPWAGNVNANPKQFLPHVTEKKYLQPMYQHVHKAIREVDDEKIIFFEGLTIDYWQNGFTESPGDASYNDRQVFAYHIYCLTSDEPNPKLSLACDAIDDYFFSRRRKDAQRLGVGMIMTEFGAAKDMRYDLSQVEKVVNLADQHQQSWIYWQLKYYEDLTTCTPQGESLYNEDGTVNQHKITLLSRSYPQAVAGTVKNYMYHVATKQLDVTYTPLATVPTTKAAAQTDLYVNQELSYPHGLNVEVTLSNGQDAKEVVSVQCPTRLAKNHVLIQQTAAVTDADVSVKVTACTLLEKETCTCK